MNAMAADFMEKPGVWLTLIFSRNLRNEDEPIEPKKCASSQMRFILERICQKAIDIGDLDTDTRPDLLSEILVSLLFGLGQEWLNNGRQNDLSAQLCYAVDSILNGHRAVVPIEEKPVEAIRA
jgi:hypothetical protein